MRRILASTLTLCLVVLAAGYSAELFTGEVRYEEGCVLCRAIRVTGKRYGLSYTRVEENALTQWYRLHVDPLHGLDPQHPHIWRQSACTVVKNRGWGVADYNCAWVSPIFLLRPEIELAVLGDIPDTDTQLALIHSLGTSHRKAASERTRLLIEYYYIYRGHVPWKTWWREHAYAFGLAPAPVVHPAPIRRTHPYPDPFLPG